MSPLARFEHADWTLVPQHLHAQIERWHADGQMPKSAFLASVLCNDLVSAVRDGNPMERAALVGVVLFLIGECDPQSWGSIEKCEDWHNLRGARGVREMTDRRIGEIYEWRGKLWPAAAMGTKTNMIEPISKFHELLQRYKFNSRFPAAQDVLARMQKAPKFVFSHDVMDFIDDHYEDYAEALIAAGNAGHSDLPHNPMLVEYDNYPHAAEWNRNFWLVEQHGVFYRLWPALLDHRIAFIPDGYFPISFARDGTSGLFDYVGAIPTKLESIFADPLKNQASVAMFYAMALHVRGIITRIPKPINPKLDHARLKRHQTPITKDYVTVHIGYLTDRYGKRHDYIEGRGGHVRVHLRRGHYRNQACGPGLLEHREIWIPSVLVNYRPGVTVDAVNYLVVP